MNRHILADDEKCAYRTEILNTLMDKRINPEKRNSPILRQLDIHVKLGEITTRGIMLKHYVQQWILKTMKRHGSISKDECQKLFNITDAKVYDGDITKGLFDREYAQTPAIFRASIPGMSDNRANACVGILPKEIAAMYPDVSIEILCNDIFNMRENIGGTITVLNTFVVNAVCDMKYNAIKRTATVRMNFVPSGDVSLYTDEFIDMLNIDKAYKDFFKVYYSAYRNRLKCSDKIEQVSQDMEYINSAGEPRKTIIALMETLIRRQIESWSVEKMLDHIQKMSTVDVDIHDITNHLFGDTFIPKEINTSVKNRLECINLAYIDVLSTSIKKFSMSRNKKLPGTISVRIHQNEMEVSLDMVNIRNGHIYIKYKFYGPDITAFNFLIDEINKEEQILFSTIKGEL